MTIVQQERSAAASPYRFEREVSSGLNVWRRSTAT